MNNILFDGDLWASMISPSIKSGNVLDYDHTDIFHHYLYQNLNFTGRYQMPVVQPVLCAIPKRIIAYRRTTTGKFLDYVPHFYTDDKQIESVWNHPVNTLSKLQSRGCTVIGPDFSVYRDLLYPQKLWNIFRNKLLVAWWQYNGITVIPNVSWINEDYECSFDGWPKASVIAVNSTGVGYSERCKALWIQGYKEMIEVLSPRHILRYGAKQKDELEDISTYYSNDNFNIAKYGWK